MTVIIALKFIHYLAVFLAGGLGVANGLLTKAHQAAGQPPAPPVQATMLTLARIGLVSIVLLWVTGIALGYLIYGSLSMGWAFHMKLVGATVLLGAVCFLNYHLTARRKAGIPLDETVMKVIPMASRGGLVLVLLGIAITTTG